MFSNKNDVINYIETRRRFFKKENLSHMKKLLSYFDNPHNNLKCIHIAGTNGKGSTSMYVTNILMKLGYNVCTYVSPYVIEFNERIEYNLNYIDDDSLITLSNLIIDRLEKENETISFFEFATLLAFIYFYKMNPDFCVIECGMGAILDDTNVIDGICNIITNVSLDHMNQLGNTIYEICDNKLGLVKSSNPLVFKNNPILNEMAIKRTNEYNSKLIIANENDISNLNVYDTYTTFDYKDYKDITLSLTGAYQAENAICAIDAVLAIKKYLNVGEDVLTKAIYEGLKQTFWPGRLEKVYDKPLTFIDGGHNIDGIKRLCEFISRFDKQKVTIICAISSDKLTQEMVSMLSDNCNKIIFTQFDYKRSDTKEHLYSLSNKENKMILNSSLDVYNYVINNSNYDEVIICSGSLYFISELRKLFK